MPILLQINCFRQIYGSDPPLNCIFGDRLTMRDCLVLLEMVVFRTVTIARNEKAVVVIRLNENGGTNENNTSFRHEFMLREH